MKNFKYYLIIIIFIFSNKVFCQKSIEPGYELDFNIFPPSPTAYELGKYGQIPVGLFTGTPQVNIPLFEYKTGSISIPISLSYFSNGIKVDQLASNVGLGWSLNAGGVITRVINGNADERSYMYLPKNELIENGFNSPVIKDFIKKVADNPDYDTQPDLFMYNFNGNSGKFTYNNDKKIMLLPVKDFKISPVYGGGGYEIITNNGTKYVFTAIEQTEWEKSKLIKGGKNIHKPLATTAWYLTKIISTSGDTVSFLYSQVSYCYTSSISESHKVDAYGDDCSVNALIHCEENVNVLDTYQNISTITSVKLDEIHSNNPVYGKVLFENDFEHPDINGYFLVSKIKLLNSDNSIIKSFDFDYHSNPKMRVFLDKITFLDPAKYYSFNYIDRESLCSRNSFSQDYWGFYNGKTNYYLLPKIDHYAFANSIWVGDRNPDNIYAQKGLLNKIIYPTKGYTKLEYEPNTYYGEIVNYPPKSFFLLIDSTDQTNYNIISYKDISYIYFDQEVDINIGINEITTNWCGQPKPIAKLKFKKQSSPPQYIEIFKRIDDVSYYSIGDELDIDTSILNDNFFINLEEGYEYTASLQIPKKCTKAFVSFHYFDEDTTMSYENIETGGSRIKKTIDYDSVSDTSIITRYYYNEFNNLNSSSGDPGNKGYYIETTKNEYPCQSIDGFGYYDCYYYILHSNSLTPLINTGNNNIYYKYVTISRGGDNFESGGETHEFIIRRDVPAGLLYGDHYLYDAPLTNIGWDNGFEKEVEFFSVQNDEKRTASIKKIFYTDDLRRKDTVYAYTVRKDYIPVEEKLYNYICKEEDISKMWVKNICQTNHNHFYFLGALLTQPPPGLVLGAMCIESYNNNIVDTVFHPCYNHLPGDTISKDDLDYITAMRYYNYSFWHYIDSTITITYDQNGQNPITQLTEYFYDNENHIQLTRTKTTDSKGNLIEENYFYPGDFDEIENYATLIDSNIISKPVKTLSVVNNKIVKGKITKYNDNGSINEVYNYESNELIDKPAHDPSVITTMPDKFKKKAEFFYEQGNSKITEYLPVDNYKTAYLWGYNYTQPIAKIENKSYSEVVSELSCTVEELQTKSENELIAVFNQLRADLPDAMITSYTYIPLVGISTETDPSGKTVYYSYDVFNRLETIKDHNGNVIKHIDYHYKED